MFIYLKILYAEANTIVIDHIRYILDKNYNKEILSTVLPKPKETPT